MSLITSCCFSQLPTQYAYVDENCIAIIPDFTEMVIVTDNCGIITMSQVPPPGDPITETTQIFIRATDDQGNNREMNFEMILLDTIAPLMQFNPDWVGYTDKEVGDMYKVYYGWVQEMGDEWNEKMAGTVHTFELPDTTITYVEDSMYLFRGTIPILQYRADEGYWENNNLDLTASFR